MKNKVILLFLSGMLFLGPVFAHAQVVVIGADQVRTWLDGKKKVLLIDTRTKEEYLQGHIPGAVNLMPDRIQAEAKSLPKDKATPMIFYCRGMS